MYNEGVRAFTANGALGAKVRVKITAASATTPPQVEVAGAGEQHIGTTLFAAADGTIVAVKLRTAPGTHEGIAKEALAVGATLYGGASGTVQDTSSGTAIGIALTAATQENDIVEFIDFTVISTAAANVSIADSGSFTATTTVEAALAEIYQHLKSVQYTLYPQAITAEDGTALTKFADGASGVGWTQLASEELALRWNDNANPDDIALQFVMPQDLDDTADIVLHLMGAIVKAGADEVDSPVVTVEAYFAAPGAAPGADDNCGGDSGEFLTNADDKWQEKTLTITAANVPASPSVLTLVLHPKDGELGTDDFVLLTPWIEAKGKILTA